MTQASASPLGIAVFTQGFALDLGLIVAIGAQNAFVLRQGLRREHVGSLVAFCAVADALLIASSVLGMAQALGRSPGLARGAAVAQAAGFTLLNPHVYLDTVLPVGSIGAQQPPALQGWFIVGAVGASLVWFTALGFGARWLAPWFARPRAWQVRDGLIGVTMFVLSAMLVRLALSGI